MKVFKDKILIPEISDNFSKWIALNITSLVIHIILDTYPGLF